MSVPDETPASTPSRRKRKKKFYGKTAKVGILWTGFRRIGVEVIGIPTTMVLARLLTPEEFGIATVGRIFLLLAEHATQVGLPAAMVRLKELRPAHMSTSLVFGLGVGAVAWLVLTGLAPVLAGFFDTPEVASVLPVAAAAFLIAPWGATGRVPIVRDMRFSQLAASTWIKALGQAATSIALAWNGFGFWSLVYGHLAGEVAGAASKLYFSRWIPRFGFSRDALADLWSYGVGRQMKGLLRYVGNNVDNIIVGRMLGMGSLGLYDKAFVSLKKLMGRIDVGQGEMFRILAVIREDEARFRKAFRKLALARTVLACPVFIAFVVVAPQLFFVLYGAQWMPAVPVFQILCAFAFLQVMTRTAAMANEVIGLMWRQVAIRAGHVVLIATGVFVGSRWGLVGVACGVLCARVMLTIMVHTLLRSATGLRWSELLSPLVPALLNAAVIATLLLITETAVRAVDPTVHPLPLLAIQGGVAVPVYVCFLLYSPFRDVRALASETVSDFFPGLAKRLRLA